MRVREAELHAALTREEAAAAYLRQAPHTNYGIARVERLDGNIGYLDLRQIPEASAGGRAIAAAMELVSHTEALIIDLRKNRGGSPNGVTFWLSYLFPDDETHLNGIYQGESGETRQFWSLAYLPGERYLDRPVSVLTSEVTFSMPARSSATTCRRTAGRRSSGRPPAAARTPPSSSRSRPLWRSRCRSPGRSAR
nr:hypothetical protein GCM10020092_060580 [Actinoplanes digitatis]